MTKQTGKEDGGDSSSKQMQWSNARILLFPPLLKRYRYLLHQITSEYFGETLTTRSIGKESNRRTCVFFKEMERGDAGEQRPRKKEPGKKFSKRNQKQKRPDMKLYVPPRAKHEVEKPPLDGSPRNNDACFLDESAGSDASQANHQITNDSCNSKDGAPDGGSDGAERNTNSSVAENNNDDDQSWDNLFDDNGDCVKPDLMTDFRDTLNLKSDEEVRVERTTIDYYQFQPYTPVIDENEFAHVLEVYDFAAELKTQDIFTSLSVFNSRDFDIKWVDDTHALAVFSSHNAAAEALKMPYHNMKLRPLSEAIKESKIKAKRSAEFLMPFKQRPETSAALARRLVTGALGLRNSITPEQRAEERKKLKEAREKRKQAIKQTQDVWEGNVS